MDIIIYPLVTIILWALSISILLPFLLFLKFNKTYRDKWFSWFFVRIILPMFEETMVKIRKESFGLLNAQLAEMGLKTPLEILEIGIGGGANLPFYPNDSKLTVLDPNESFLKYFEENRQKYPQVTYRKTVIGMAEDMRDIEDSSFDVVVATYVLCYIKDVQSALKEIKRVLKPGGMFLFIIHTTYPDSTWKSMLQRIINPLWKITFNGCDLIRKDDEELKRVGFRAILTRRHYPEDLWLYVRSQVTGIATK